MLKETKITNDGILYKKAYKEELSSPQYGKKMKQRYRIQGEVFDIEDSVADNAKWLSILTTFLSRLYVVMPEEQKALLDPTERSTIEFLFAKFAETNTRADVQFQSEGFTPVVEKILDRQKNVGNIVK